MESIKHLLNQVRKERPGLVEPPSLTSLLQDKRIKEWLTKHPEYNEKSIQRHYPTFYQYKEERAHCDHCPGLDRCPNLMAGYQPVLTEAYHSVTLQFTPCELKKAEDERKRQSELIHSFYVPKDVLKSTFQSVDKAAPGRHDALKAAGDFVRAYIENPGKAKGLYFYGKFGVGKTYIMGAIMNAIAEKKGISSLMVYTPDFFREMKSAIQDQTLDGKLAMIKSSPLLILDDIGAETMTPWVRDELLGTILQYRMMENLPTLFTSNYDYDELEAHLAYSQKSGTELLKARRIMERIRHYTTMVTLDGENRRTF